MLELPDFNSISNWLRAWFIFSWLSMLFNISILWDISRVCFVAALVVFVYRRFFEPAASAPPRSLVPQGKTRIGVSGMIGGPAAKAHYLADLIANKYPDKYETWYFFGTSNSFYGFTKELTGPLNFKELGCEHLIGHASSPFCFLEKNVNGKNVCQPIGGADYLSEFAKKEFPNDKDIIALANETPGIDWYITGKSFHTGIGRPIATAK
jgi:hypothetical protein